MARISIKILCRLGSAIHICTREYYHWLFLARLQANGAGLDSQAFLLTWMMFQALSVRVDETALRDHFPHAHHILCHTCGISPVLCTLWHRFGDLTNRMNVENEPLDTPVSIKPRASISASASGNGSILGVNDSTIGGSRGGSSARRLSSRASPHEVSSIAGRTRSRLSVGSTPGPTSVREVR